MCHMSLMQEISFKKKNFKNYPIWMKNGIKRAVMALKQVHEFFDTSPIKRESLNSSPLERGLFECLLSIKRIRQE